MKICGYNEFSQLGPPPNTKNDDTKSQLSESLKLIQKLKSSASKNEKNRQQLEEENEQLHKIVDRLKSDLENAKKQVKTHSETAEKMQIKVDNLEINQKMKYQSDLSSLKLSLAEKENQIDHLETINKKLKENQKQASEFIKNVNSQLEKKIDEIESLKSELWQLRRIDKENKTLNEKTETTTTEIRKLQSHINILETQNEELNQQIQFGNLPFTQQIHDLEQQNHELRIEIERLKDKNLEVNQTNISQLQIIKQHETDKETMKIKMNSLKLKIHEFQNQIETIKMSHETNLQNAQNSFKKKLLEREDEMNSQINQLKLKNNEFSLIALSSEGHIFKATNLTDKKVTFTQIYDLLNEKVNEISGTFMHCIAVCSDGKVFASGGFGHNDKPDKFVESERIK